MPTFFIDSGSFRNLQVTGSTIMSASSGQLLQLIGSGSTLLSISGSAGEMFRIADDNIGTLNIFSISSGSITILDIDSTKQVRISGSATITGSLSVGNGTNNELSVTSTGVAIGNIVGDTHNVVGTLNVSNSLNTTGTVRATQQIARTTGTSNLVYRTTNAGSDVTPEITTDILSTAGSMSIQLDNTNGIVLSAGNGTRAIARMNMYLTHSVDTAGSEEAALIIRRANGAGAAADAFKLDDILRVRGMQIGFSNLVFNQSGSVRYRLTNSGGDIYTPFINSHTSGLGVKSIIIDSNFNSLMLAATNLSGVNVVRAAIDITNLSSTAGAESADMIFLTKPGSPSNTAATERMRISSTGAVLITGSLTVNAGSGNELFVASTGVTIGNVITDTHNITGSVNTSGSLSINGSTTGTNWAANSGVIAASTQFKNTGDSSTAASTFRLIWNGTDLTPLMALNNGLSVGGKSLAYDPTYGLLFLGGNNSSPNRWVARAALNVNFTSNTQGVETGELQFYTNGGAGGGIVERMRITSAGNIAIGKTSANATLDVNGNTIVTGSLSVTGVSTFTGNLNAVANVAASTQGQFGGSNASANRVYRTTNTGADVTPQLWIGNGDLTSGRSSISIEGFSVATLGSINFHTVNASNRYITRAAIRSSGSLNTAASESGDLIFLTKPGAPANTAITERLRITSTGTTIVSGTFAFSATSSAGPTGSSGQYNGEIVTFGAGTLTAGQLYFLSSSSTWSLANADSTGSSTGMLGIAVGTTPSDGLLIRGFAYSASYTTATGSIVYAATSSGLMTTSSPSSSNHVVRVVGYVTNIPNTIYFDPDKTWVTLA